MQIILASQSPRRRDYMEKMFGRDGFEAIPSDIPEPFDDDLSFTENAEKLALAKGKHVQQSYPDALIIASDTVIEVDGQLLAKAETKQEAEDMIRLQLGKKTHVVSALAVLSPDRQIVTHAFTELYFKDLDDPGVEEVLTSWVESEKWHGFGGAYAIQDDTAKIIRAIRGDIANVIGFPVQKLQSILETEFGVSTKEVTDKIPEGISQLR